MSTDIATRTPQQQVIDRIREPDFTEQLAQALPENVPVRRFVRATVTALMANADVVNADRASLMQSLLKAAQDGLMPDGQEAALVVYKTKVTVDGRDEWIPKVQYIAMIGGLRRIAAEHRWTLQAAVVYANDTFDYQLGEQPFLTHKPEKLGQPRGDRVGAYAVATHADGRKVFEVLDGAAVEKVKASSRASGRGPWVDWTDRMWEKTAARALFKRLPLADDERVVRITEAPDPEDAERALYGHPHEPVRGELPRAAAATPASENRADAEPGDDPPTPTAGDQQAGSEERAAAPSDPAPEPEPEPQPGPEPEPTDDLTAAEAALDAVFPNGEHKGKTLRVMFESGTNGELSSIRWALRSYKTNPFRDQVWAAARVYAPELAEQVEKSIADGQAT